MCQSPPLGCRLFAPGSRLAPLCTSLPQPPIDCVTRHRETRDFWPRQCLLGEIPAPLVKVYGPAPGPVCREIVLQRFILLHLWSHPGLWPLETADQSCPSRYSPQVQSSRFSFVKNRSWHEPQFYQSCLLQIITDFLWASVSPYVKCEW